MSLRWSVLVLGVSACTASVPNVSEGGDAIDDSFLGLDGKSDSFGVVEGSPDALGLLRVASELTSRELDDDARLDSRAALAIVAHRQGSDRRDGTSDDNAIDSLLELDSISYVGSSAFTSLLTYARDNGYINGEVDPCNPDAPVDLSEGGLGALGVLAVVNTLTAAELDDDAAIDSRAARNIVSQRNGRDGVLGTRDDQLFGSILQLDAVSYVGTGTLNSLLVYAQDNGFIGGDDCNNDPCARVTCGSGSMCVEGACVSNWRAELPTGAVNVRYNGTRDCTLTDGVVTRGRLEVSEATVAFVASVAVVGNNPGTLTTTLPSSLRTAGLVATFDEIGQVSTELELGREIHRYRGKVEAGQFRLTESYERRTFDSSIGWYVRTGRSCSWTLRP